MQQATTATPDPPGLSLGPLLLGTLLCRDGADTASAYCDWLQMSEVEHGTLEAEVAALWGCPELTAAPYRMLASVNGTQWLRIVEKAGITSPRPFSRCGWIAMEICVLGLDQLADGLAGSPFTILGAPAALEVGEAIRAMQVLGPAGEVLYLTEIGAPLPPFQLPRACVPVDRLFIGVLACTDRNSASAFYGRLAGVEPLCFDTRIGTLNRVLGLTPDSRHAVATVQLAGQSLLEFDELAMLPPPGREIPVGIAMLSFRTAKALEALDLDWAASPRVLQMPPYHGRRVASCRGPAGEWIELIQDASPEPDHP